MMMISQGGIMQKSFNFNLRGIPPQVMIILKKEAENHQLSVNLLILKFIEQGIGYTPKGRKKTFHDLDELAGTWSEEEAKLFDKNTTDFEKIDEDLWK